jgi:hypothetical protein
MELVAEATKLRRPQSSAANGRRRARGALRDLGYEEAPIQGWISAVMFRLRSEVKKQESAKQEMLVQPETGPDQNAVNRGKT